MWTETQAKSKQILFLSIFYPASVCTQLGFILPLLTASPSLHFQLPLSIGFLRFRPIQNQCCSWSSDSLWATSSSIIIIIIVIVIITIILHHMSPGQRCTPTQMPHGGPAERSAPPQGRWYSAGWLRVSGRTGEPAASSASAPAGRSEIPAHRW